MPDRFRAWGRRWAELNPGWTLREWGEGDLEWLRNRELFRRLADTSRAAQADVARYEVLLREGGLYVDTDVEPLRPLGDLLDHHDLVLAEQFNGAVNNAVMAAVAGHPFLARLVDGLEANATARRPDGLLEIAGPGYLNRALRRWSATAEPANLAVMTVIGRDLTHPYSWHQRHLASGPFGDAVAVHHWAISWSDAGRRSMPTRLNGMAREGVVRLRGRWRTIERAGRRLARRLATVGEREPHPRRQHRVTPLGDGRLLVHTREGVVVVADAGDVAEVSPLVRDGTLDPTGIALHRRLLQPGDTVVHLGPGTGLEPLVAAWAVGVTGRVVARCATARSHDLLMAAEAANRADGMHPTLVAVPPGGWSAAAALLRGTAEIRLVRAPASPAQAGLIADLLPSVEAGRVRHLDLQLSDVRAGASRDAVNDVLVRLGRIPGVRSERLDARGRLQPLGLDVAVHHAEVGHLLVSVPPSA